MTDTAPLRTAEAQKVQRQLDKKRTEYERLQKLLIIQFNRLAESANSCDTSQYNLTDANKTIPNHSTDNGWIIFLHCTDNFHKGICPTLNFFLLVKVGNCLRTGIGKIHIVISKVPDKRFDATIICCNNFYRTRITFCGSVFIFNN